MYKNGILRGIGKSSVLAILLTITAVSSGKVIYADNDACGSNDGSSWENAYIYLQDAVADANLAAEPVEIRVAHGIYKPDMGSGQTPGDRKAAFEMLNGVSIIGGYAGASEILPDARNPEIYLSILSGDLNGNDIEFCDTEELLYEESREENSFHVVCASGTDRTAVLDGFTITSGLAHKEEAHFVGEFSYGGGMYVVSGSPSVNDCRFVRNAAEECGGSVYIDQNSAPLFSNCLFAESSSTDGGGFASSRSNPTITKSVFAGNKACSYNADGGLGGGMHAYLSEVTLTESILKHNSSDEWGGAGGLCSRKSTTTASNCFFICNSSGYEGGGAVNNVWGSLTLINCTLHNNMALEKGGAVHANSMTGTIVSNSILWDNGSQEVTGENVTVSYSDVKGGYPGVDNIDADPELFDPDQGDYHLRSERGRYWPEHGVWVLDNRTSPCIDAGSLYIDVAAESTPNGLRINMGAYGGTTEASMSEKDWIPGDINRDRVVDFRDIAIVGTNWLECEPKLPLPGD